MTVGALCRAIGGRAIEQAVDRTPSVTTTPQASRSCFRSFLSDPQPLLGLLPIAKHLHCLTARCLCARREDPRHPERRVPQLDERATGARSAVLILCRRRHVGRLAADFGFSAQLYY